MKKRKLIQKLLCVCSVLAVGASLYFLPHKTKASAGTHVAEMFTTYDCTIEPGKALQGGEQATSVIPEQKGASVSFKNSFASKFSICFDVADHFTVGEIAFRFDSAKKDFGIVLDFDKGSVNACVESEGVRVGISGSMGNSALCNRSGEYTKISAESSFIEVVYDAIANVVYIENDVERKVVWNFNNLSNDGCEFEQILGVADFNASIEFVSYERYAPELLIKSVCDCSVGSGWLVGDTVPQINAVLVRDSVAGKEYEIPRPVATDIKEGEIDSIDVRVKDSKGQTVKSGKYTDGFSFQTKADDEFYKITYSASNACERNNEYTLIVLNYESEELANTEFVFDVPFEVEGEYGENVKINLPSCVIVSDLFKDETSVPVKYCVKKDGVIFGELENVSADSYTSFLATEEGHYVICLQSADGSVDMQKTFEFDVVKNKAQCSVGYIPTQIGLGERYSIPSAKIYLDSVCVDAESKIITPSGACYLNHQILLTEKGLYEIVYSGKIGGAEYAFSKFFTVIDTYNSLFTLSENSSASLSKSGVSSEVKGVKITTRNNGVATYNNVIDLNRLSRNDLLVELMADTSEIGTADFTDFVITLTDIYDPSNYLTISCMFSTMVNSNGNGTYIKAAASNGQILVGWYNKSLNYTFGYDTRHSFIGKSDHGDISENTLKLYFDYATKRLYSGPTWGAGIDAAQDYLVTDFDDSYFYSIPWNGFTTGEAYLSVKVSGATKRDVSYVVSTINATKLDQATYVSNTLPSIRVNLEDDAVPFGLVNVPYKVFSAVSFDGETGKELPVQTFVYYNYGNENQVEFEIRDGKFTPNYAGEYTIVYRSKDKYGIETREEIPVNVLRNAEQIDFDIDFESLQCSVGELVKIPEVGEITGNSGSCEIFVEVSFDGEKVDLANRSVCVDRFGRYTITITVKDYLEQSAEKVFYIDTVVSENPILIDDVVLPKYFLTEHVYALPNTQAVDYYSDENGVKVAPKIYVSDPNGADRLLANGVYEPQNTAQDEYETTVKYVYETVSGRLEKTFTVLTVKAKDNKTYYFGNYFNANGVEKNLTLDALDLNIVSRDATVDFANAVNFANFAISFAVDANSVDRFETFELILTDYSRRDLVLVAKVKFANGVASVSFNGGKESPITIKAVSQKSQIEIVHTSTGLYDADGKILFDLSELEKEGKAFVSDKIYVGFHFKTTANATVSLININNQNFNNASNTDRYAPEMVMDSIGGVYEIGSSVKISGAKAYDVLSDIAVFTISVSKNGSYLKDKNGTTLKDVDATKEYLLTLDEYGTYNVALTAKDTAGRSFTLRKSMLVIDREAPVLSNLGGYAESYKVGDKISVFNYSVVDNVTQNPTCLIYVIQPSGAMDTMEQSYTFATKGTHRVIYFAFDESGNASYVEYTINVK